MSPDIPSSLLIHCTPQVCQLSDPKKKKNSIVMLPRNLDPTNDHCDGTRYIIQCLHQHVIDAVIACGPHAEIRIFIPRIPIIPAENAFPFHMKRIQFPLGPANKAQGRY
ncbi:pif1 helicase [Plakobranchus ocellatus]|uniref:Pif1 helicase n=1 Tax=Plakobranchus ocellatus TaxID=259542 RepID=A0AAV3YLF8_9GAST|nr:pif1 helicase [Plakobranchus ocellatus]